MGGQKRSDETADTPSYLKLQQRFVLEAVKGNQRRVKENEKRRVMKQKGFKTTELKFLT